MHTALDMRIVLKRICTHTILYLESKNSLRTQQILKLLFQILNSALRKVMSWNLAQYQFDLYVEIFIYRLEVSNKFRFGLNIYSM